MQTTVVANGQVADGTGKPAFLADVVVAGDRIVDVVPLAQGRAAAAVRLAYGGDAAVFDAAGRLVTPGFVDAHAHSDAYLVLEPSAPSKISQGVTTEINGQCGGSAAPRFGAARLSGDWASLLGDRLTWRSFADYRAALEAARPAVNVVAFVGHNTLRSSVLGYAGVKATPETLRAMQDLLARSLDEGARGLTTGLIYQPGKYADAAEVEALARTTAARGGLYATHMRSEGDRLLEAVDEVLALVAKTGVRAEISHLKTSGRANWGKIDALLDKMQRAVDEGRLLGGDRYPYCAAGTDLDVVLPDWAGEGGCPAECARLADPAVRARIVAALDASGRDWSAVTIGGTWSAETKPLSGKTVAAVVAARAGGATAGSVVCDVLAADACRTGAFFFGMSADNLQAICARPWIVPGSDASLRAPWGPLGADHPHPRAYGTMPRFFRLLTGRLPGHARICSREEAIMRMTSVPARRFGLVDRGEIRKGAFADLAVWREDAFRETATYDAPHAFCAGMDAVFVNGILAYRPGEFSLLRAGRFL